MASRHSNSRVPEHIFLFDSLGSKTPRSLRKIHIRRLVDVLQVSIHRQDWPRAQRAWCILVRCKEFEWRNMWKTGLLLTGRIDGTVTGEGHLQRLEYLRVMMLRSPEHRVSILQETIIHLITSDLHQDALDELELYLPSSPYQDNPVLHIYAGLLRLYLAQANADNQNEGSKTSSLHSLDQGSIRECKYHFQRALDIDPDNIVALGFIAKLKTSSLGDSDVENETDGLSDVDSELRPSQSAAAKRPYKKRRAEA